MDKNVDNLKFIERFFIIAPWNPGVLKLVE